MPTMLQPTPPPPSPPHSRSKFRIRRVHGRRSSSHNHSSASAVSSSSSTTTTTTITTAPAVSSPPGSPSTHLSRELTRTTLSPLPASSPTIPIAKRPPHPPPTSPRRAAMRAAKDAKSCPSLPLPLDLSPALAHQPRPTRRGSLPVPKLPPLNLNDLASPCPVSDNLHTARRRVDAISISLSRFRPYLYVAADAAARDLAALRRAGVTHVVNLAGKQSPNYHPTALRYLHLYVRDDHRDDIAPLFDPVAAFIDEARRIGGAVLIHCRQGISRSVTAALAYVMSKDAVTLDDAMRDMRQCRPIANPNPGFYDVLRKLQNRARHGRRSSAALVVRRHATDVGDLETPVVAQKAGRTRGLDEREVYILQRSARRGVVVWQGRKAEERAVRSGLRIARRIAEQERVDAGRFPEGGAAKTVAIVKQGDSERVEQELLKVLKDS